MLGELFLPLLVRVFGIKIQRFKVILTYHQYGRVFVLSRNYGRYPWHVSKLPCAIKYHKNERGRKILTGYSVNFNKRHSRYGHSSRGGSLTFSLRAGGRTVINLSFARSKIRRTRKEAYLRELVRYIHLNLLRARIVKNLTGLNRSPWSGHSALLEKVERIWR